MREIIAKSGMKKDELIDRLKRGADALEIQLLAKESDSTEALLPYADKIRTVHSMLDRGLQRSVLFENMDNWTTDNLEESFEIAQLFSQEKRMVGVVVHLHTGLQYLEQHHMFNTAFLRLEMILRKYPNTYALIENGMVANQGTFTPGFNSKEFANTIRKIRNMSDYPERVFSLLDTTHTKSNALIESQVFRESLWTDLYEGWFRDASDTIKEIHFANCINLGMNKEEHGVDFSLEDMAARDFFRMSMDLINAYCLESMLCIEVQEKDYSHAENFTHIQEMIKNYRKKAA